MVQGVGPGNRFAVQCPLGAQQRVRIAGLDTRQPALGFGIAGERFGTTGSAWGCSSSRKTVEARLAEATCPPRAGPSPGGPDGRVVRLWVRATLTEPVEAHGANGGQPDLEAVM